MAEQNQVTPEPAWLRQQLLLTVVGTVLALGAAATAVAGLSAYPFGTGDVIGYPIAAVTGSVVLAACTVVITVAWLSARARLRAGGSFVARSWRTLTLVALVVSYAVTLVAMFGALAASALAGWDSPSGVLFGICFLTAIFGQILAGTQELRAEGPPGTVPTYLRRLNALVQSKR